MDKPAMITLSDGNLMPQLGLGVWKADNDKVGDAVLKALDVGYRLIDTAAIYENEEGVGKALQQTSVPREELFITTKLWNSSQLNAKEALETSLQKLQLDYVDLYLIHWPAPSEGNYLHAWQQLIELQKAGLTRSIGVCNFEAEHLQKIISETNVTPVINQIELHPLFQQKQMHAWNTTHHIQTESWSPLAQGGEHVFDTPIIKKLAAKYRKTPAQIVIRWHLDSGLIVIPKSVTPSRIEENFAVFDFKLEKEEITEITLLDQGKRLGPDPKEFK